MSAVLHEAFATSTDATRGQPLDARVRRRQQELEDALGACVAQGCSDLERQLILSALATVYTLTRGAGARPTAAVDAALGRWLERHKHLAQRWT